MSCFILCIKFNFSIIWSMNSMIFRSKLIFTFALLIIKLSFFHNLSLTHFFSASNFTTSRTYLENYHNLRCNILSSTLLDVDRDRKCFIQGQLCLHATTNVFKRATDREQAQAVNLTPRRNIK